MKQLIFMIAATLAGTVGVYAFSPFLGVAVYYLFAVLRPHYMWQWSLPADVSWSYYVALATMGAALITPRAISFTRAHWLVLAFGVWIAVTYVLATNHEVAYPWFLEYVKIFLMFAASAVLIRSIRELWILLLMTAAALGYIAYEVNYLYLVNGYLGIQRNGYGGLDNNGAALLLAMGVPLCYFSWEGMSSRWRWMFLGLIPVILHAVLMTYSRGAMVSLTAVAPLFFLRSKCRRFLLLLSAGFVLLLPILAGKEIRARFFSIEQQAIDHSANSRRSSWAAAWGIAKDHPVFGVGIRNANLYSYAYGADIEGRTIHSQYLQIAADNGFVGLGLYLTIVGATWVSCRQVRRLAQIGNDTESVRAYYVCCAVEGALLVFCVGGLFLSLEVFELPYILFLLAAQMTALMRQRQQETARGTIHAQCLLEPFRIQSGAFYGILMVFATLGRAQAADNSAKIPPSDPLTKSLLSQGDFEFLGSFRMPTSAGHGCSTAASMGGLTHRYINGELRFLSTGHVYGGGPVYETNYPGVSMGKSPPIAKRLQEWGDVYGGHVWVGNGGGSSRLGAGLWVYGLHYDEPLGRLYWNYGHGYNATHPYNPSFGYSTLDDSTGKAKASGPWGLANRAEKLTRGGTVRIPQWFAGRYTDGKSLGVGFGGYFSVVSSASYGPALAATKDPDSRTDRERSALSNIPLVGYPFGCPERAHRDTDYTTFYDRGRYPNTPGRWNPLGKIGFWTDSDIIYGAASWIDLPSKGGLLFIAKVGQGNVWYEKSDRHAQRGAFEWFVYHPKDLAAVATGGKRQWQVQPRSIWIDKSLPLSGQDRGGWSGDGASQVGGITFDQRTRRLYVLVTNAWKSEVEYHPQVHVFQVR